VATPTVLFLCTGNTCRSPLAEALARKLWADGSVRFRSAGLQAVAGQPASEGSRSTARELGVDLDDHRARPLGLDLLDGTQWVIAMTRSQLVIFKRRFAGFYTGKIGLLGEPGVDLSATKATPPAEEVDDPIGGTLETYCATGRQIERLLRDWTPVLAGLGRNGEDAP
jgi:protein-tyrosine-phosphatase